MLVARDQAFFQFYEHNKKERQRNKNVFRVKSFLWWSSWNYYFFTLSCADLRWNDLVEIYSTSKDINKGRNW